MAGAAVPLLFFGRVMIAVSVVLAFLAVFIKYQKAQPFRIFLKHTNTSLIWLVFITAMLWLPGALGSEFPIRSAEAIVRTPALLLLAGLIFACIYQSLSLKPFSLL